MINFFFSMFQVNTFIQILSLYTYIYIYTNGQEIYACLLYGLVNIIIVFSFCIIVFLKIYLARGAIQPFKYFTFYYMHVFFFLSCTYYYYMIKYIIITYYFFSAWFGQNTRPKPLKKIYYMVH